MKALYGHKDFQADAVKDVVDVLVGQPYLSIRMIDRGNENYQIGINEERVQKWILYFGEITYYC